MKGEILRFWSTAVGVAAAWAILTSVAFPYDALGLETGPERGRAWLLTVWTSGVLAVCFGAAGLLGFAAPLGFKEVAEAGSVLDAIEARRRARRGEGSIHSNFAWWLVITGLLLIAIYFLVWGIAYA